MPTAPTGRRTPLHRRLGSWLVCLALATGATSCSSDETETRSSSEPVSGPAVEAQPAPAEVRTTVRMGKVYGRLPRKQRTALRADVGAVVDRWWEASYVGGDYPRTRFARAFPGFTRGAEAKARRDKALTTNRDISEQVSAVTVRRREVTLDVLALDGTARTVTARFRLRFDAEGAAEPRVGVDGRLFLTRRNGGWRVFGYDMAKWSRA